MIITVIDNAKKMLSYCYNICNGIGIKSNSKLIMTILVRDEADIVKANIRYHLDHGVDFIIATDNGSIDGTDQILEDFERQGVLFLIREDKHNFMQSAWVNRMGRVACERFGADIVFHCDADEFWWAESGSLKNEMMFRRRTDSLYVGVYNMIKNLSGSEDIYHQDNNYAVTRPLQSDNPGEDSRGKSFYLFTHPAKVFYKTNKGYLDVGQGNHELIAGPIPVVQKRSFDIKILHYPLRGYNQFLNKVRNGGSAYEKNPSKAGGWQWRRWYDAYKNGNLDREYEILALNDKDLRLYAQEGILEDWSEKHKVICAYL